jgi:endonuclease YncB( thermonuclease family)
MRRWLRFLTGFLAPLLLATGASVAQTPLAPTSAPTAPQSPDLYSPQSTTATVPMRVEVVTSTTFRDVETRQLYRLYGVDACDPNQTATLGKQTWPCGVVATAWLVNVTLNRWVACTPIRQSETLKFGRCATGEIPDLAAEMLKLGHAIALPSPEDRLIPTYAQLEKEARAAYRGIWASSFQMPWTFRHQASLPNKP